MLIFFFFFWGGGGREGVEVTVDKLKWVGLQGGGVGFPHTFWEGNECLAIHVLLYMNVDS